MKNIFKMIFCKHEYKTITNIHGDLRNTYNCMSIKECIHCGKWQKCDTLDKDCDYVNFHKKTNRGAR